MLSLAVLPGIPMLPFLALSALTGGAAWKLTEHREKTAAEAVAAEQAKATAPLKEEPIQTAMQIDLELVDRRQNYLIRANVRVHPGGWTSAVQEGGSPWRSAVRRYGGGVDRGRKGATEKSLTKSRRHYFFPRRKSLPKRDAPCAGEPFAGVPPFMRPANPSKLQLRCEEASKSATGT